MGIRFQCPACGAKLNVKTELGGKRGVCPKCQAKIQIPADSPDPAEAVPAVAAGPVLAASDEPEPAVMVPPTPPAPTAAAPKESKWFVRPPSGGQYGPAAENVLRQWIGEGRITPDTLVWREGDPEWLKASAAFPELASIPAPVAPTVDATRPVAVGPVVAGPGPSLSAPAPAPSGETDAASAAAAMLMARRKRARSTGLLVMGILSIAVLVLLVILVLVLLGQSEPPAKDAAAWRHPVMVAHLLGWA